MAMEEASGEGCSEPLRRFECVFVDPIRDATQKLTVYHEPGRVVTLLDLLWSYRSSDLTRIDEELGDPRTILDRQRFADSLFLLKDNGAFGEPVPGLRFRIGGQPCELDHRFEGEYAAGRVRIEIDRSLTGYSRNWPAYMMRRWKLRAEVYSRFIASIVEQAFPNEAESILRLDTPKRVRRFLVAVASRIYSSSYETYSRYLEPGVPFRSCDQALDRIIEGDGGNCAEKAMAFYFIAHAYGIKAELVLGGEDASAKFPYRALRSILDQRMFAAEATRDAQRHWQHFAVLCRPSDNPEHDVFCDVAGSNIPFLFLGPEEASPYLDLDQRTPIRVIITLDPIHLYYHRLSLLQDLPLDLYYAMENYIESIDVIHTVDNELGLLHTGDYWIGVVSYRGRRELSGIVKEYERYIRRAGLDPRSDICFAQELSRARHPLHERFLEDHRDGANRIIAADVRVRHRINVAKRGAEMYYVIINLQNRTNASRLEKSSETAGPWRWLPGSKFFP